MAGLETQKPHSSIRTADRQKRFFKLTTSLPASLHNKAIRSFLNCAKLRDNLCQSQDNLSQLKLRLIPRFRIRGNADYRKCEQKLITPQAAVVETLSLHILKHHLPDINRSLSDRVSPACPPCFVAKVMFLNDAGGWPCLPRASYGACPDGRVNVSAVERVLICHNLTKTACIFDTPDLTL